MRRLTGLGAGVLAALLLGSASVPALSHGADRLPAAQATDPFPAFASSRIVPGRSIGGFSLSESWNTVLRALGSQASSSTSPPGCAGGPLLGCPTWRGPGGSSLSLQFGQVGAQQRIVLTGVVVSGYGSPGRWRPLAALRTARGIGLGATLHAVRTRFPALVQLGPGIWVALSGSAETSFRVEHGRIVAIGVMLT